MLVGLVYLVIALIIVGVLLWVVDMLPLDPVIKQVIRVVVVLAVVIWLLYFLIGFLPAGGLPLRR
jgi:hypothetical protein